MQQKILIVDDEPGICGLLKDYFEMQDYLVYTAENGTQAIEKIRTEPDIILLDVNMPDIDGFEVCRRIREHVSCPILFLTAKIEEQDRINGLVLGGDDYILKPFSVEELGARVMAHLRREQRKQKSGTVRVTGDLAIHYSERSVFCNGKNINFTKTEFDILEFLSMHPGQVFGKEQIYESIWGFDGSGDSNIVMEHIRRIRMKIAAYTERTYIETVWGVGYKWIG